MNTLFSLVNELEKVKSLIKWEEPLLPHVVVIGTRGGGKTSVVESIIGQYIFPHCEGPSTRCPVVLHLKQAQNDTFVTFKHCPNKVFLGWDEVQREVKEEMERNSGLQTGINSKPIFMELQGPNFAELTLVDLPGFSEVALDGQPKDICRQLKKLSMQYIRNPTSIILAVAPATTDLATNDCLMLSRLVDGACRRTIVVVSKLDMAGPGTDLTTTLKGQEVAGFPRIVGVVGRSLKQYREKKKMEDVLKVERKLLQSKYGKIAREHGTQRLQAQLAELLHTHIRNILPAFRKSLSSKINRLESELTSLGSSTPDPGKIMLEEITRYANAYCSLLTGNTVDGETDALVGGARICYIFQEVFGCGLDSVDSLSGLNRSQIMTALLNTCGTRPDVQFIPESCFENLARRQVQILSPYCRECVEQVYTEMMRMIRECTKTLFTDRYPVLYDAIYAATAELIERGRENSGKLVEELLDMELSYINTLDSDFQRDLDSCKVQWLITRGMQQDRKYSSPKRPEMAVHRTVSGSGWFGSFLRKGEDEGDSGIAPTAPRMDDGLIRITPKEDADCQLVENLIHSYLTAVKRSLKGGIPKAIMLRLVSYVHNNLYHTLLNQVQQRKKGEQNLLKEPDSVEKRREELKLTIESLREGEKIISTLQENLPNE